MTPGAGDGDAVLAHLGTLCALAQAVAAARGAATPRALRRAVAALGAACDALTRACARGDVAAAYDAAPRLATARARLVGALRACGVTASETPAAVA